MTTDDRIITGAHIEAADLSTVLVLARQQWCDIAGFDQVQVWLGRSRLVPQVAPSEQRACPEAELNNIAAELHDTTASAASSAAEIQVVRHHAPAVARAKVPMARLLSLP